MLYYVTLLLVIVIFSVIAIWIYRLILGFARTTHTAMLPGRRKISAKAKARLKMRQKARAKAKSNTDNNGDASIPTPWGWRDEAHTVHSQHSQRAANKPGSDRKLWSGASRKSAIKENHGDYSQQGARQPGYAEAVQKPPKQRVGWPYREDKMAFAGKAYKVKRKTSIDDDVNAEGKPWVW